MIKKQLKKIFLVIFLFINVQTWCQSLKLTELQSLIFKPLESIENYLRANKFEYEQIGRFQDKNMLIYQRPMNTPIGFERIMIIVNQDKGLSNYDIMYHSTKENLYYQLKTECDSMKNVKKVNEIISDKKIHRIYCDGSGHEYNFMIINDEEFTHTFTLWIKSNFTCGL